MKKNRQRFYTKGLKLKIATNCVLGFLVLSVGALSFAPVKNAVAVEGREDRAYRCASENPVGVSLTFNVYQGTEYVYEILNILERYDAQATFFIGGCWADDNVQCLRDIHALGHEIGNHGYFHKSHDKLSVEENSREISSCNQFIKLSLGQEPTLFAPPSGAYGNDTFTACKSLGMKIILWTKDTIDWRDQDVSLIYKRATNGVKIGDFILMHPTKGTVSALENILKYYNANSLKAVSVSKNLQNEG